MATVEDESRSLNFMCDELFDGRLIPLLKIVDNFNRKMLAIKLATGIEGQDVVHVVQSTKERRPLPRTNPVDNGPEFMSKCWTSAPV